MTPNRRRESNRLARRLLAPDKFMFLGNGLGTPLAPENSRSFAALESRESIAIGGTVGGGSVASGPHPTTRKILRYTQDDVGVFTQT